MIRVCVDSGAQLPDDLGARHGVEVVPLTVEVDGVAHLEGVDLDADGFYDRFASGAVPEVHTAAPAPGAFLAAYERLAAAGATEIISVHTGSEVSGTLNSARLAADRSAVPVHLVDTHSASFVVSLAVLSALEVLGGGGAVAEAASAAEDVAGRCGNVFVVGALDLARAGGRLDDGVDAADAIPVLALREGRIVQVGTARSADEAAAAMTDEIRAAGNRLRVGIGTSDASSVPVANALVRRLEAAGGDLELIPYRVGPSVGAHTGPGTAGAVYHLRR